MNGRKASGKELLKEGDLLKLFFSEESFQKLCAPLPPLPEDKEKEGLPYLKSDTHLNPRTKTH